MQEGFPKKFNHNRRTIQWKWKSFEIHGIWCYCNSVIIVQYWWSLTIFQWYCHNFESISNVKHLKESKPILNSLSFVCTYPCKNCNPFLKTYVCSISHDSDFLCLSFSFPAATVWKYKTWLGGGRGGGRGWPGGSLWWKIGCFSSWFSYVREGVNLFLKNSVFWTPFQREGLKAFKSNSNHIGVMDTKAGIVSPLKHGHLLVDGCIPVHCTAL